MYNVGLGTYSGLCQFPYILLFLILVSKEVGGGLGELKTGPIFLRFCEVNERSCEKKQKNKKNKEVVYRLATAECFYKD